MSEQTSQNPKARRQTAKAAPALLITAAMFIGAVVTILLVIFGQ